MNISETEKKVSIRTILILLFIIQILFTVVLIGALSFNNGYNAVNEVTRYLHGQLSKNIEDNLKNFLKMPHLVNNINNEVLFSGYASIDDFNKLEREFWREIPLFDSVSYISFGDRNGNFIGIERKADGTLVSEVRDNATNRAKYSYLLSPSGKRKKLLNVKTNYDSRIRPWYKSAEKAGKPVWSDIYLFFTKPSRIGITAVYPVFDNNKNLLGVFGTDLILDQINRFLRSMQVGKTGHTFIMENSGFLVASSSTNEKVIILENDSSIRRIKAVESSEPLIREASINIFEKFGNLSNITKHNTIEFYLKNSSIHVEVFPLKDQYGLNWIVAVVIPESDFMGKIDLNTRVTFILCIIALIFATVTGSIITSKITKPLFTLSNDMQKISDFKLDPEQKRSYPFTEIQIIQSSMEQMYKGLREYTRILNSINKLVEKAILTKETEELFRIVLVSSIKLIRGKKGFIAQYLPEENNFKIIFAINTTNINNDSVLLLEDSDFKKYKNVKEVEVIENHGEICDEKFSSAIYGPFVIEGELMGLFFIMDKKDNYNHSPFSKQDKTTMETLAKGVSPIWHNIILFEMATTDTLTKLYVRRYIEKLLEEEIKRALRYKNPLGIIMLDIDNFKLVNDNYGHQVGDKVIIDIAKRIKECIRETDFASRFGGEEFLIFMPQTDLEGAYVLSERIRHLIQKMEIEVFHRNPLKVTVSIGVSCLPEHGISSEELILRADEALYFSKRNGKNKVTKASIIHNG